MSDPNARDNTVRGELARQLRGGWMTARQLSRLVGISEKAVPGHLEHLQRSAPSAGERFEVDPAVCLGCDYSFDDRERLSKPSRCPKCRGQRIDPPSYRIAAR